MRTSDEIQTFIDAARTTNLQGLAVVDAQTLEKWHATIKAKDGMLTHLLGVLAVEPVEKSTEALQEVRQAMKENPAFSTLFASLDNPSSPE